MITEREFNKTSKHSYDSLFRNLLKHIIYIEKIIKKNIENGDFNKQLLWLSLRRFISHGKAISILCKRKQNLEALMLLRPIIELIVNLRWIVEDNTDKNRGQFMKSTEYEFNSNGTPKMGGYWTDKNLKGRMIAIGFDEKYYDAVIKKMHEELHTNPGVVGRAHNQDLTSMNSNAIFSVAYQWTGHLLKVVNQLYPNEKKFINYRDVWSKIKGNSTHKTMQKTL